MFDLIVLSSFEKYQKGDRLSGDDDLLEAIQAKYPHNVTRIARVGDTSKLATHMLVKLVVQPVAAATPAPSTAAPASPASPASPAPAAK